MQKWTKLYREAMEESNPTKLPRLLDEAIDAVCDQIEDTLSRPNSQQGELSRALNELRSRRRAVFVMKNHETVGPRKPEAA
jgi:hypothetical protein